MAIVQKKEQFMNFYSTHCKKRHYLFSVRKCSEVSCTFHQPSRIEKFDELHHLPDPVPKGEHYESFDNLFGQETTEKFRPSLTEKAKEDKNIPFNPTKQTALCVSQTIVCEECGKSRLLHSKRKIGDKAALLKLLDKVSYTCGSSIQNIIDEDEDIVSNIFVRADITCTSTIELPYYSA